MCAPRVLTIIADALLTLRSLWKEDEVLLCRKGGRGEKKEETESHTGDELRQIRARFCSSKTTPVVPSSSLKTFLSSCQDDLSTYWQENVCGAIDRSRESLASHSRCEAEQDARASCNQHRFRAASSDSSFEPIVNRMTILSRLLQIRLIFLSREKPWDFLSVYYLLLSSTRSLLDLLLHLCKNVLYR